MNGRREFLKAIGGFAGLFTIDEDHDGHYVDDLLDLDDASALPLTVSDGDTVVSEELLRMSFGRGLTVSEDDEYGVQIDPIRATPVPESPIEYIDPGTPVEEINEALSVSGTVAFKPGDHFVIDRIRPTADDLTIIVHSGAHIKLKDTASPTPVIDQQNHRHIPLFYVEGATGVDLINHGRIDANAENHVSSTGNNPIAWLATGNHKGVIENTGVFEGGAIDTAVVWIVDSDGVRTEGLVGTEKASTLNIEGCHDGEFIDTYTHGGAEAVDINAYCKDCTIRTASAEGGAEAIVDIDESPGTLVEDVTCQGTTEGLITVNASSGNHFSTRPAPGHCDDVTVRDVKGTTSGPAIRTMGMQTIHDLTIENFDVESTEDHAVNIDPAIDGQFDGLKLEGKARATASGKRAISVGNNSNQTTGVEVDVIGYSAEYEGVLFQNCKEVRGKVKAHDCSNSGLSLHVNSGFESNGHILEVHTEGNNRGAKFSGEKPHSDMVVTGVIQNNSSNDLETANTENSKYVAVYGTRDGAGTNNSWI